MSLMLTISDPAAVVLSTTNNHLDWLGRDREGVVGHGCHEWASPQHWPLNWYLFQHALSTGMPLTWERPAVGPDGRLWQSQMTVKPLRTRRHGLLAICTSRIHAPRTPSGLRGDILRCLAEVTEIIPRGLLQQSLEEIAAETAALAERSLAAHH